MMMMTSTTIATTTTTIEQSGVLLEKLTRIHLAKIFSVFPNMRPTLIPVLSLMNPIQIVTSSSTKIHWPILRNNNSSSAGVFLTMPDV
jgi:hypothetical protein